MTPKNNQDNDEDVTRIVPKTNDLLNQDYVRLEATSKQDAETIINVTDRFQQPMADPDKTISTNTGCVSESPSLSLKVGSVIKNRFILREIIGCGGMGTVFRATDLRRQEAHDESPDVAIKVLNEEFKENPELFIGLQRETKKTQQLAHPNIVTVYDFDRDGNNVFMVMEILEGQSLKQFIKTDVPNGMPFKKAWPIIKGLSLALAYAHKRNIIHSDFKPGNVFITSTGEVKILDFGIACAVKRPDINTKSETIFNARDLGALTPEYASLEMFENQPPDPRDDIYALACVTYELLTGKHPFGKLSAPKVIEVRLQPPVISGLKRRQWNALMHALALKKEQRTPSVHQFIKEIEPRPIVPLLLMGMTMIALLSTAGGYFYFINKVDPLADKINIITPAQELKIKDLLELAQIHFEVGFITAPTGSNALWAYRQVLEIDPYNRQAKEGLEKIANLCNEQAESLYQQNKISDSLEKIEEGLEAMPKHEGLLALKKKILSMQASRQ
jgi:serine/threonine protein kinase